MWTDHETETIKFLAAVALGFALGLACVEFLDWLVNLNF